MLVCGKCHMEYEEGTPFCPSCGGPLVKKERESSPPEGTSEAAEVKADGRLICPKCHILYEKLTICVRCGAPLVTQSALKERKESLLPPPESKKTEPKVSPPSEAKIEPPAVPPATRRPIERRTEELQPPIGPRKEKESFPPDSEGRRPPRPLPKEDREAVIYPAEAAKRILRSRTGILSLILLCLVSAYLIMNLFGDRARVAPETPTTEKSIESSEEESPAISEDASATVPSSGLPVVLLPQEIQRILDLLENIRQANLKKNIDLLMSCYASDYQDREERRRTAIQSWSSYNFLDLSYILKVESLSIDTAKARVEWQIRSIPLKGGQIEEGRTTLSVVFKKEGNEWKIREVTPAK